MSPYDNNRESKIGQIVTRLVRAFLVFVSELLTIASPRFVS
jgi:hypothetical protein